MEFNGFGALMVFKDDRINVACFDHASFRALRDHPDHSTLMMLKKPVLLKLVEHTKHEGTANYDKQKLCNFIMENWQEVVESTVKTMTEGQKLSVFHMPIVKSMVPAINAMPSGSTDPPRFGDADGKSDGSITPKTPVACQGYVAKKWDYHAVLSKDECKQKKIYEEHRKNKMDHYHRKVKRSMGIDTN